MASVFLKERQLSVCLIQVMEPMTALEGDAICNELGCPLLTLTKTIRAVHPNCVLSSVSIVHQCTESCIFVEMFSTACEERESVLRKSLVYQHDWTNDLYCLNIFCTNQ